MDPWMWVVLAAVVIVLLAVAVVAALRSRRRGTVRAVGGRRTPQTPGGG